jgi:hypothetical protein
MLPDAGLLSAYLPCLRDALARAHLLRGAT